LLGSSFYNPYWKVGHADGRGMLTIASTRSGKGRSAIIPNLLTWPGSALVIDPKGTNAAVTAARRGHGGGRVSSFLGQEVYVVDPFGIVPGVKSARFNPLSMISLTGQRVTEDIGLIADALVVPGESADTLWDDMGVSGCPVTGFWSWYARIVTIARVRRWERSKARFLRPQQLHLR
jgi:hypothetical protein